MKYNLLALLLFANIISAQIPPAAPERTLVLTHIAVIDATGSPVKPDMSVIIRNHKIVMISGTAKLSMPDDAEIVDGTGKFLIPGLWDAHVHTGTQEIYLPLYIANGITGVRDMGGDLDEATGELSTRYVQLRLWREQIERGRLLGPRIVMAGFLIDGFKWPGNVVAMNAIEGREAVTVLSAMGVDFIKVKSFLSRDAYFAVADEAQRRNIGLAGHVPDAVRVAEASDAGQKSIEHLTGVSLGCSSSEQQWMDEKAKAFTARDRVAYELAESRAADTFDENVAAGLFAKFVKNDTWQVPTLVELRNNARGNPVNASAERTVGTDPRWRYLPASVREKWNKGRDTLGSSAGERQFTNEILLTKKMHQASVQFMAGTDSANTFTLPGFALHEELELLVEAGFTPMEAIQAATLNPAKYLGREKELGTIESGKLADLVLLDANPLVDIRNSKEISAVVVNGRYLSRADLDSMLSRAEAAAK